MSSAAASMIFRRRCCIASLGIAGSGCSSTASRCGRDARSAMSPPSAMISTAPAHLPGMLAAVTPLPVIGVPVPLKYLDGMDSLLSIVQMPAGVPVATVAIGNARNAGLLAIRILAAGDLGLRQQMLDFQDQLRQTAEAKGAAVRANSRPDQPA